ncbi:abortive infection family protein [Candidatus Sumerlaeota bacterium]|nr:abortive infection family protein [Candidatus Sumerlaeota bacterium]
MRTKPPLTDAIIYALARLVDDAQKERRDPSHSDIEFCVTSSGLERGDPKQSGQTVGKAKRVRLILSWAIENSFEGGRDFVDRLIAMVRSCGGFRPESAHYVGSEEIQAFRDVLSAEGFILSPDGHIQPAVLDSLVGTELTEALGAYVRRAQRGSEDAALVVGTGKDLLEAIAAHVLVEVWNNNNPPHNFPTLLGQAFAALDLKTSADNPATSGTPQQRLQRALYEAACAINTLRNKQGTGHGHPWLPSVTSEEARHATQVMGIVGDLLLRKLQERMPS